MLVEESDDSDMDEDPDSDVDPPIVDVDVFVESVEVAALDSSISPGSEKHPEASAIRNAASWRA